MEPFNMSTSGARVGNVFAEVLNLEDLSGAVLAISSPTEGETFVQVEATLHYGGSGPWFKAAEVVVSPNRDADIPSGAVMNLEWARGYRLRLLVARRVSEDLLTSDILAFLLPLPQKN